jgi:hypothetical protein
MRLFAPPDDPIRSNDRSIHQYTRRFWWTRAVHIAVECRLCDKRREIKDKRLAREYERRRKEKKRQEFQEREDWLFEPEADENPRERLFDFDDDE